MQFLHTADLHIGRLFHGQSLLQDQSHALQQIVEHAVNNQIDALLIAGDVYDRQIPPVEAVTQLELFLDELTVTHKIPVILISGNHDSASRLGFANKQMARGGLHMFSSLKQVLEPVIFNKNGQQVHCYGIPFCTPSEVNKAYDQTFSTYDQAHTFLVEMIKQQFTPGVKNVLLSHCFMLNAETSDSERTLSVGGSDRVSSSPCEAFDYVALGHLHRPQSVSVPHIRYSGSLLKYSFSEHLHHKGVSLINTHATPVDITHIPITPLHDMRVITGKLKALITNGHTDPRGDDYILAKLTNTESLLDPINQLRTVYPNILQIERFEQVSVTPGESSKAKLARATNDLFSDFYTAMTDQTLTSKELDLVNQMLSVSAEDSKIGIIEDKDAPIELAGDQQ